MVDAVAEVDIEILILASKETLDCQRGSVAVLEVVTALMLNDPAINVRVSSIKDPMPNAAA